MPFVALAIGAACAFGFGGTTDGSTAYKMHGNEAAWIAQAVSEQLAEEFPPAATELLLVGPTGCVDRSDFHPVLDRNLRGLGFALASHIQTSPTAPVVRYHIIKSQPDQTIVQLEIDDRITTRLLTRDRTGALRPSGPIAVRH